MLSTARFLGMLDSPTSLGHLHITHHSAYQKAKHQGTVTIYCRRINPLIMDLHQWALPEMAKLLPLDEESLGEIITYTKGLPDEQAAEHFRNILGDTPQSLDFIGGFVARKLASENTDFVSNADNYNAQLDTFSSEYSTIKNDTDTKAPPYHDAGHAGAPMSSSSNTSIYAPPAHAPPPGRVTAALRKPHTNSVIEAARIRARDEVLQLHFDAYFLS